MKYCPNYSVPITASDDKGQNLYVSRARCKQWSCEYCAAINKRIWQYRIGAEVERDEEKDWTFVTITLPGWAHYGDVAASLHFWRKGWDKFMKRLKREYGKFPYLRVFESHKDGTLHVHLLMGCAVPDAVRVPESDGRDNWRSPTIRKHAEACGFGWRHDARPLRPYSDEHTQAQTVAVYVSKYLTKDIQSSIRQQLRDAGYSRVRMIQTSHGWAKMDKSASLNWSVGVVSVDDAVAIWARKNDVIDLSKNEVITLDDYYDYDYYPNPIVDLIDRYGDKM